MEYCSLAELIVRLSKLKVAQRMVVVASAESLTLTSEPAAVKAQTGKA
jgi:hypothetical protein